MSAGVYDIVTIDKVIAGAKMALDLENVTDYDDKLEYYCNEAAGNIDSGRLYIKKPCWIDICDGKAKLPKGFVEIIGIKPVGHEYHGYSFDFNLDDINDIDFDQVPRNNTIVRDPHGHNREFLYMERKYMGDCDGAHEFSRETVEINDGYLWFTHPHAYKKLLLLYMGTNCDEYGIYIIYSDWAEAMREYAVYKMLQTRPKLWDKEYFQYYSKTKEDHYQEYVAAKDKILSKDASGILNKIST